VAAGLAALGVEVEPTNDGMCLVGLGGPALRGAALQSHHDHRLAMAWAIASLVASGETTIADHESAAVSYPGFWETLAQL
jgi:3-phosphoshikimate 1-carboxyvinyltransferase